MTNAVSETSPSFRHALWVWCRIGLLSFGGPAGQIAVMERILVQEKAWISAEEFLNAINLCMLIPGPEAMQLVTYCGWRLHGWMGGLAAGILFIAPGFISILALSIGYVLLVDVAVFNAALFGLKAAVLAVVINAIISLWQRAITSGVQVGIAGFAFASIFFVNLPFPLIILAAAGVGFMGLNLKAGARHESRVNSEVFQPRQLRKHILQVLLTGVLLWVVPPAFVCFLLRDTPVFIDLAYLFGKAAIVTFGGAYAVLAYIAQQAVDVYGWLTAPQMLDGLGLAETTPGPLIQVVQFVGFLGAYGSPGQLAPLLAGGIGALVTTWVTFVPSFFMIFALGPQVTTFGRRPKLRSALSGVTAAVLGVIIYLALWFGLHVCFSVVEEVNLGAVRAFVPVVDSVLWSAVSLTLVAWGLLRHTRLGIGGVLVVSVAASIAFAWKS